MTRVLLVRHATCDPVGVSLAGRAVGVRLNVEGRLEAERLADRLAGVRIDAIYASPLERASETADAIARPRGLAVELRDALTEIEFGEWTGRTLAALAEEERWRRFNVYRSGTRPPGGELALEAQLRIARELELLRARHPDGTIAVVSHGDVLRAGIAHLLGLPLDLAARLAIDPASVSVVAMDDWGARLDRLNDTGPLA